MQTVAAQTILGCLHAFLDKGGCAIAEGFQICHNMYVDDMRTAQRRQRLMLLLPIAPGLISGQSLSVILPHGV